MFSWFDASEAQKFGIDLAEFFMERIPPEPTTRKEKSLGKKKEILEKIFMKLKMYTTKNKLNFYQKAKLFNAFKWKLLDAKYDPIFVDDLTKTLTRQFLIQDQNKITR